MPNEQAWERLRQFVENNLEDARIKVRVAKEKGFCQHSRAVARQGAFREVLTTMERLE